MGGIARCLRGSVSLKRHIAGGESCKKDSFLKKKTLNDIHIMIIVLGNSVFCGIFAEK